jgi:hypothetical protein
MIAWMTKAFGSSEGFGTIGRMAKVWVEVLDRGRR